MYRLNLLARSSVVDVLIDVMDPLITEPLFETYNVRELVVAGGGAAAGAPEAETSFTVTLISALAESAPSLTVTRIV